MIQEEEPRKKARTRYRTPRKGKKKGINVSGTTNDLNFTTPTTPKSSPGSDAPPLVSDESEVNGSTIVVGGAKNEECLPTIYELEEIHEAGRVLIDSFVKISCTTFWNLRDGKMVQ